MVESRHHILGNGDCQDVEVGENPKLCQKLAGKALHLWEIDRKPANRILFCAVCIFPAHNLSTPGFVCLEETHTQVIPRRVGFAYSASSSTKTAMSCMPSQIVLAPGSPSCLRVRKPPRRAMSCTNEIAAAHVFHATRLAPASTALPLSVKSRHSRAGGFLNHASHVAPLARQPGSRKLLPRRCVSRPRPRRCDKITFRLCRRQFTVRPDATTSNLGCRPAQCARHEPTTIALCGAFVAPPRDDAGGRSLLRIVRVMVATVAR